MNVLSATICLISREALDRHAYRLLLEECLSCTISGDCDFTRVAIRAALRGKPDLVLALANQATPEVCAAVQVVHRVQKKTRVLVLASNTDRNALRGWARCKIDGLVFKEGGVVELGMALDAVLQGQPYFSAGAREAIKSGREAESGRMKLSPRESEILPLLACGLTLREAAQKMAIRYKTADSYRTTLLRKLRLHNRVDLARYAIRERIIQP